MCKHCFQRKHPALHDQYEQQLAVAPRKRQAASSSQIQTVLPFKHLKKETIDSTKAKQLIRNFIVEGLHELDIVSEQAFIAMLRGKKLIYIYVHMRMCDAFYKYVHQ